MKDILLGYEIGTAEPVSIPLHHLVVTGVTQLSGKTTTLEALISRSGFRAIAFRTKRGESGFENAHPHKPYFHERSDWQYVQGLLEATMRERMKFERSWIIKATKGTRSLREVYDNISSRLASGKMRSLDESVYTNLKAYLEIVLPEIERGDFATELNLGEGVTVMDLEGMSDEMKSLVIASTLESVYDHETELIVVIPEAWQFVPEGRGSPVKRSAEKLIRQGASIRLFLWFDSQDIAGVDKSLLKQVDNWILGRQREINEVEHTLAQVPIPRKQRPKPEEIMQLGVGHFVACFDDEVRKVYVQPAWLSEQEAMAVAKGKKPAPRPPRIKKPEVDMDEEERKRYEAKYEKLQKDALQMQQGYLKDIREVKDELKKEHDRAEQNAKAAARNVGVRLDAVDSFRKVGEMRVPPLDPRLAQEYEAEKAKHVQLGPINIEAKERDVRITYSEELREFTTTNPQGRILYVLLHDLKNEPSGGSDISAAMREHGWNYSDGTLWPTLSKMVNAGDLVAEGKPAKYRLPGKPKIKIEE